MRENAEIAARAVLIGIGATIVMRALRLLTPTVFGIGLYVSVFSGRS